MLIPLLTAALQNMLQNHRDLLHKIDGEEIKIKFNPSEGISRDLVHDRVGLATSDQDESGKRKLDDGKPDNFELIGAVPDQLEPNSENDDKWLTNDSDSSSVDEERNSELIKGTEQVNSEDSPKSQSIESGKIDGDKSNSDDSDEPQSTVTDTSSTQVTSQLEIPRDLILPDVNAEDIPRIKRAAHARRALKRMGRSRNLTRA